MGQGQNNAVAVGRQKAMKHNENQLTIMLLLVTTLFLILMIPTYIRFLYTTFVMRDTPAKDVSVVFFYHLSQSFTTPTMELTLSCTASVDRNFEMI